MLHWIKVDAPTKNMILTHAWAGYMPLLFLLKAETLQPASAKALTTPSLMATSNCLQSQSVRPSSHFSHFDANDEVFSQEPYVKHVAKSLFRFFLPLLHTQLLNFICFFSNLYTFITILCIRLVPLRISHRGLSSLLGLTLVIHNHWPGFPFHSILLL